MKALAVLDSVVSREQGAGLLQGSHFTGCISDTGSVVAFGRSACRHHCSAGLVPMV